MQLLIIRLVLYRGLYLICLMNWLVLFLPLSIDVGGIRKKLKLVSKENNYKAIFPEVNLCGDNAAMIAMVGLEKFKLKKFDDLDFKANPRWPLDKNAKFLKGAGVKL